MIFNENRQKHDHIKLAVTFRFNISKDFPLFVAGVKMLPCSSGWCKKFVGGNQDKLKSDQAIEHERGCLTRGPPDNKPRCFEHDFGMMCICKGDLCNQAPSINVSYLNLFSALIIGWTSIYLIKGL